MTPAVPGSCANGPREQQEFKSLVETEPPASDAAC